MTPTPIEKTNTSPLSALLDLCARARESELQIEYYKKNFLDNDEECEEEKMITEEAMKDLMAINSAIMIITDQLNIEA